jgi:hypothetical protein
MDFGVKKGARAQPSQKAKAGFVYELGLPPSWRCAFPKRENQRAETKS